MRVAHLGPPGTFSEEALRQAAGGVAIELDPRPTIHDAIDAVEGGAAERAFVPFENSIEGAVRSTLDALAFDSERTTIVGEYDYPIRHNLIGRAGLELERIEVVHSHPQANAQCARFLREQLPGAEVRGAESTSEAVGLVASSRRPWAAIGPAAAAAVHGCAIIRSGVEDASDNVTRFVWLADAAAGISAPAAGIALRTTLAFSELGDDRPGALVDALTEFSARGVNLTRIESRPLRRGLGRYLFFIDLEGSDEESAVADAVAALRGKAETVRLLGSYPVGGAPPL